MTESSPVTREGINCVQLLLVSGNLKCNLSIELVGLFYRGNHLAQSSDFSHDFGHAHGTLSRVQTHWRHLDISLSLHWFPSSQHFRGHWVHQHFGGISFTKSHQFSVISCLSSAPLNISFTSLSQNSIVCCCNCNWGDGLHRGTSSAIELVCTPGLVSGVLFWCGSINPTLCFGSGKLLI